MSGLLVKIDDHHAREPRGAERARARREGAGAARRRGAHAQLRRARPARGLRRPRVLRQGRVRRPAHDGHADGGQASRRRSIPRSAAKPAAASCRRARASDAPTPPVEIPARSDVAIDVPVFTPPFVGSRVAKGISLDEIAGYVNETALFRNQWQFRPEKGGVENDEEFKARIRPTLREQLDIAKQEGAARARRSRGATSRSTAKATTSSCGRTTRARRSGCGSTFPRQRKAPFLCIADFFRPVESGEPDYAGVPRRDDGPARERTREGAVRRRTSTRTTCCCTASRSR